MKKLWYRLCLNIFLAASLSGCSAVRGIGDTLFRGFQGINIHFPTIRFP
jgi:hypothetical protein